jgi:endogenous inhibitor of DNA gyrase (YacG/DUF329 family)
MKTGRPRSPDPDIINICKNCKKEFIDPRNRRRKRDFCCISCATIFRNIARATHIKVTRECIECGKSFAFKENTSTRPGRGKFCGNKCRITKWNRDSLEAQKPGSYKANGWKTYERKCADCGYDEHPEIILLHHVDGNRQNGAISNLVPLCQNCHCLRHLEMNENRKMPPSFRGPIGKGSRTVEGNNLCH